MIDISMNDANSVSSVDNTDSTSKKIKVLLYSSGMDSFIIDKLYKPDIRYYFDIDGLYSKQEIRNLPKNVEVVSFKDLKNYEMKDNKILPMRNLYFIMKAINETIIRYGVENISEIEVVYGAIAGDNIYDKSEDFMIKTSELLSLLLQKHYSIPNGIKITIPVEFKKMSKQDLVRKYKELGYSAKSLYTDSFSCAEPNEEDKPCFKCKPCIRKAAAVFDVFGIKGLLEAEVNLEKLLEGLRSYDFSYKRGSESLAIEKMYYTLEALTGISAFIIE